MKKGLTYEACGVSTKRSKEKKEFIKHINELVQTLPMQKYVIGGIGGFAGLFDLGKWEEDRMIEEFVEGIKRKYGKIRAPYILAAYWLQKRREEIERRRKF